MDYIFQLNSKSKASELIAEYIAKNSKMKRFCLKIFQKLSLFILYLAL